MTTFSVSMDDLESRAWAESQRTHQLADIEVRRFMGVAVLRVGGDVYIAPLPPLVEDAS